MVNLIYRDHLCCVKKDDSSPGFHVTNEINTVRDIDGIAYHVSMSLSASSDHLEQPDDKHTHKTTPRRRWLRTSNFNIVAYKTDRFTDIYAKTVHVEGCCRRSRRRVL